MSPWTNYTFRVIARNKVGDSLPSGHSKDCLTPEDVPYKNPDNVLGRGTQPNNLVISWTVSNLSNLCRLTYTHFLSFFVSSVAGGSPPPLQYRDQLKGNQNSM